MKKNVTEIVVVVDRSGSMQSIKKEMEEGFNKFIEDQKNGENECVISLYQFDSSYEEVYSNLPLKEAPKFELHPRGGTALLDALGRTITNVHERLNKLSDDQKPDQVIFMIITDGQENESKEFQRTHIFDMIKERREKFLWEFVFLGTDQDAIAVARDLGASTSNAVTYERSTKGVSSLFDTASRGFTSYRSSRMRTMDSVVSQDMYNQTMSGNIVTTPMDQSQVGNLVTTPTTDTDTK